MFCFPFLSYISSIVFKLSIEFLNILKKLQFTILHKIAWKL